MSPSLGLSGPYGQAGGAFPHGYSGAHFISAPVPSSYSQQVSSSYPSVHPTSSPSLHHTGPSPRPSPRSSSGATDTAQASPAHFARTPGTQALPIPTAVHPYLPPGPGYGFLEGEDSVGIRPSTQQQELAQSGSNMDTVAMEDGTAVMDENGEELLKELENFC